jgi:GNAT superfamily N-acetyltransferase
MFQVKKMNPEDYPFAVLLANSMDWNMTIDDFTFNAQLEPEGCLMLFKDKEPIGIATCISYGKVGWFGNLIVKEAYRRQGAGAQLVNHAVSYLKGKGALTVGLYAYPYLSDFYGKLGFKANVDFIVLKAPLIYELVKPEGTIKPIEKKQISIVMNFDYQHFGGLRSKVLELIFSNPTNLCFTAVKYDQVVGYVAAKVFGDIVEIGPLVCLPNQPIVAAKLLQKILSQIEGKKAYLYVRASEVGLQDLAYRMGFMESFRLVRMFLGLRIPQHGVHMAESLERG